MKLTKTWLRTLAFACILLSTLAAKAADVKFYEFWKHTLLTTLAPVDDNTYAGTYTLVSWGSYLFEVDGVKYGFPNETGVGGYNDLPITKTVSAGDDTRFYFGDIPDDTEVGILFKINGDNTATFTLCYPEDLPKADPTPLSVTVNGSPMQLSDDINGLSETFSTGATYEVAEGGSLAVGPVTAGDYSYGVQTQPVFTAGKDEQTQTLALATGGSTISVTQSGYYTVGVSVKAGKPASCIITKASGNKIPLKIAIGSNSIVAADDVEGMTGDINVQGSFDVAIGGSLAFGPVTIGETSYGFSADPAFNASDNTQQTATLPLSTGTAAANISVKGSYSFSVKINSGQAVSCSVVRAAYVPVLTLDGAALTPDASGVYAKDKVFYAAGAKPAIVYEAAAMYLGADILADDGNEHTIPLATSDQGHKVAADGIYLLKINPENNTLAYTCTSYRDPSLPDEGISSTFPQSLLDWTGNGYTADDANTIFYEVLNPGWSEPSPEYDMKVFVIGNGDFGATLDAYRCGSILLNHKTSFKGTRPTEFNGGTYGCSNGTLGAYEKLGYLAVRDADSERGDTKYLTELNMSTGVVSNFALRDTPVASEFFVSNPDDVFVNHITSLNPRSYEIEFFKDLQGSCTDGKHYTATKELESVSNTLSLVWETDGTVSASGSKVTVSGATRLLVVVACASSYDINATDFNSGKNLLAEANAKADIALAKGYKALYADHVADHSALYGRCSLQFDDMAENNIPLDKLMEAGRKGTLTEAQWRLVETLIFNYGRYTLMGSARRGHQLPSNLQGIWSNGPHWNSDIHADVNVEMNYWPAESTALGECHEPFLDYIIAMSKRPEWKGYAHARATDSHADAWCLGNANNIFGTLEEFNSQYSEANAWFCNHLWQHYEYTLDRDYLARIVPVMKNACRFWEAELVTDENTGKLYLPNCWSPENNSADSRAVHGRQLVTDLFTNTIAGAELLGGYDSYLDTMRDILANLDDGIHVNNGALEEWVGVTPGTDGHRHLSHLMCLYPLGQVSPFDYDTTPFEASVKSVDLRGDSDGGEAAVWVDAWRANLRARALQGGLTTDAGFHGALGHIHTAVSDKHLQLNLNSTTKEMHQIEGNAGLTSAIAEMLMQSYRGQVDGNGICGHIHLLPALPAQWASGTVRGMRAVGNFTVDIDWRDGEVHELTIVSNSGRPLRVQLNGPASAYNIYADGANVTPKSSARRAPSLEDEHTIYFPTTNVGGTITVTREKHTTGVEDAEIDSSEDDAPVEYYTIQGFRVAHPEPGHIYIRRQGTRTTKVLY